MMQQVNHCFPITLHDKILDILRIHVPLHSVDKSQSINDKNVSKASVRTIVMYVKVCKCMHLPNFV